MNTNTKIVVMIDSKYYRDQFDDWLAGGKLNFKKRSISGRLMIAAKALVGI